MTLSVDDTRGLIHYFGEGATHLERSPFGASLERAAVLYRDSEGKVIPRPRGWNWDQAHDLPRERPGDKRRRRPPAADPGPHMLVHETRTESSHELDETSVEISGWVSRRVAAAERAAPGTGALLRVLYGDEGERWQRQKEGRAWALAPLTDAGRGELARLATDRRASRLPDSVLSPAEQLADAAREEQRKPLAERRAWLERVRDQIEAMEAATEGTWRATRDLRGSSDLRDW